MTDFETIESSDYIYYKKEMNIWLSKGYKIVNSGQHLYTEKDMHHGETFTKVKHYYWAHLLKEIKENNDCNSKTSSNNRGLTPLIIEDMCQAINMKSYNSETYVSTLSGVVYLVKIPSKDNLPHVGERIYINKIEMEVRGVESAMNLTDPPHRNENVGLVCKEIKDNPKYKF
jgi:hypothetical protein